MRTLWDKRMRSTDVYGSGGCGCNGTGAPPLWTIGLSAVLIALEPAIEREMRALRAIASCSRARGMARTRAQPNQEQPPATLRGAHGKVQLAGRINAAAVEVSTVEQARLVQQLQLMAV
jgi:hypothetical protein